MAAFDDSTLQAIAGMADVSSAFSSFHDQITRSTAWSDWPKVAAIDDSTLQAIAGMADVSSAFGSFPDQISRIVTTTDVGAFSALGAEATAALTDAVRLDRMFEGLPVFQQLRDSSVRAFQASLDTAAAIPRALDAPPVGPDLLMEVDEAFRRFQSLVGEDEISRMVEATSPTADIRVEPADRRLLVEAGAITAVLIGVMYSVDQVAGEQLADLLRYFGATGLVVGATAVDLNDRISAHLPNSRLVDWAMVGMAILAYWQGRE